MAINPVQLKQQNKKDPMDKILQGLQIANEVFKIPVGVQEYRAKSAEAGIKESKNQSVQQFMDTGEANAIAQNELGLVPAPKQQLLPGEKENPLLPKYVSKEADDARYKKESALRDDYSKEVQDIDTAAIKYQNVVDGLSENRRAGKGNNAGHLKALFNAMMLFQPGVTRGADGRILNDGGSIPEEILKSYNRLLGNKNVVLTDEEEIQLFQASKSAFKRRAEQLGQINKRYRDLAEGEAGVRTNALGLRDYALDADEENSFGKVERFLPPSTVKVAPISKSRKDKLEAEAQKRGLINGGGK